MNLTLTRKAWRSDGIFSVLTDEHGNVVAHTLEHSYPDSPAGWMAKIPEGTYACVRGPHRLHGMTEDFITFEITGIDGHTDLLFHWGNWNKDSEGCVLVGQSEVNSGGVEMVTASQATFVKFMTLQAGINTFTLTVTRA